MNEVDYENLMTRLYNSCRAMGCAFVAYNARVVSEKRAEEGKLPYWAKLEDEPTVEEKKSDYLLKLNSFKKILVEIGLEKVDNLDKLVM